MPKKQISITIENEILKKVDLKAEDEGRNRSNYIEKELKKSVENGR